MANFIYSPKCDHGASSCGCGNGNRNMNNIRRSNKPQSWYDLPTFEPKDPRDLIANVKMNGISGSFVRSSNFIGASSWGPTPFILRGDIICNALHSDDQLAVANAAQWTVQHQGGNFTSSSTPLPVKNMLFLRGGVEWEMNFQIDLGLLTYNNLQLSFRDNATSAGNFTGGVPGTIPVFQFQPGLFGIVNFAVTLKHYGHFYMVISAIDNSMYPVNSMFEMEWISVK